MACPDKLSPKTKTCGFFWWVYFDPSNVGSARPDLHLQPSVQWPAALAPVAAAKEPPGLQRRASLSQGRQLLSDFSWETGRPLIDFQTAVTGCHWATNKEDAGIFLAGRFLPFCRKALQKPLVANVAHLTPKGRRCTPPALASHAHL